VVTYALEAEYTVKFGTVNIADKLLTLMMQQVGRLQRMPRCTIEGRIKRVISCMANTFTYIEHQGQKEIHNAWIAH
jgi:hypothetical protein